MRVADAVGRRRRQRAGLRFRVAGAHKSHAAAGGPPGRRRARQLGGTIAALSASQLSRATTGIACISRAPHVAPMVSTLLGRLMAFGVGVGVGSAGSYYFILEELKSSTAAILAANKALAARVGKVESAAKKQ